MKTKVSFLIRSMTAVIVLLGFSAFAFADGETTEVFLEGTSHSSAGNFVVQTTDDLFYFQGSEYEVYNVYYDDPGMNMKIAVNNDGRCRSFVAYNGDFMFFYDCNEHGFGVRKVMFSNPWAKDQFSSEQFQNQSVLQKKRRIDKKQAVGLIAAYVPQLAG